MGNTAKGGMGGRASRIRKKQREGKYIHPLDMKWLADYDNQVGGHRPAPTEKPIEGLSDGAAGATAPQDLKPDTSADYQMPGFTAPLPEGEEPMKAEPVSSSEPINERKDAGPTPKAQPQPTDAHVKQGIAWATKFCDFLKGAFAESEKLAHATNTAAITLPDEFVDTAIMFAAVGTFTRAARLIDASMSARAQDATVLISGGGAFVQRHFLRRRAAELAGQAGQPAQAQQPAQSSAQPSPDGKRRPAVMGRMLSGKEF